MNNKWKRPGNGPVSAKKRGHPSVRGRIGQRERARERDDGSSRWDRFVTAGNAKFPKALASFHLLPSSSFVRFEVSDPEPDALSPDTRTLVAFVSQGSSGKSTGITFEYFCETGLQPVLTNICTIEFDGAGWEYCESLNWFKFKTRGSTFLTFRHRCCFRMKTSKNPRACLLRLTIVIPASDTRGPSFTLQRSQGFYFRPYDMSLVLQVFQGWPGRTVRHTVISELYPPTGWFNQYPRYFVCRNDISSSQYLRWKFVANAAMK